MDLTEAGASVNLAEAVNPADPVDVPGPVDPVAPAGVGPSGSGAYSGVMRAAGAPNSPGSCRNVWVIGSGSQPATGSTAAVSARSSRAGGRWAGSLARHR